MCAGRGIDLSYDEAMEKLDDDPVLGEKMALSLGQLQETGELLRAYSVCTLEAMVAATGSTKRAAFQLYPFLREVPGVWSDTWCGSTTTLALCCRT